MTAGRASRRMPLPAGVFGEAFPFDPDLPQLAVATDPVRMREVFRACLKPVGDRAFEIGACVPFRFRFRQSGSRCVLQYTLRLVETGTGRQWDQWVTGLLYTRQGEAHRLWLELRAAAAKGEPPVTGRPGSFEPVAFIPDLEMLVQVFPYDRKLPQLAAILGGAAREIEPLLLGRLQPGRWQVTGRTLVPTRYRTELGAALKMTVKVRDILSARSVTRRCYLKVFRNAHGAETYDYLGARAGAGPTTTGFALVRPLAYLERWRTLALEEAAGVTLQQWLLNGRDPAMTAATVGRAVAAFNQAPSPHLRPDTHSDQLADVERAARLVQWAWPPVRQTVQNLVAAVTSGLEQVRPAPIHRDLKPDHIFISNGHVCFIDCDSVALGDPARDPAHLFAHIVGGVGLDAIPLEQRRAAATAFVREYFAHVPAAWRRGFPLQCAGALIEVAGGIFKRQESGWREKVATAVREAKDCFRKE